MPYATNSAVQVSYNGLVVGAITPAVPAPVIYTYDALGRPSTSTDPGTCAVTTTTYDPATGQPSSITTTNGGLSTSTVNAYYGAGGANPGQLASTTVNGMTTSYTYNAQNQVTGVSGNTYPLSCTYDAFGALQTPTTTGAAGAATTTWNYDPATGLLQQKLDASNHGPSYTYTPSGAVATRTWARGVVTTYTYDGAGMAVGIAYSDGTPGVTMTNNARGKPVTVTDAAGFHTLTYTADGQLASDIVGGNGILSGTGVTVGYDAYLRRRSLSGTGFSYYEGYSYDPATGNLAGVTDNINGSTVNYAYQPNSTQLASTTFYHGGALRLTTARAYDGLGRLASIANTTVNGVVSSHAYVYNAQNQRSQVTREDGSVWNYTYDQYGQLIGGHHNWNDGTPAAGQQFDYAYDSIGNRTSTTTNGRTASYTPNALNQYTSRQVPGAVDILGIADPAATVTVNGLPADSRQQNGYFYKDLSVNNATGPVEQPVDVLASKAVTGASPLTAETQGNIFVPQTPEAFAHDPDGNLVQDGQWTYTWDGANRLASMTAISSTPVSARKRFVFSYDRLNRRIQKQTYVWNAGSNAYPIAPTSAQIFVYDGWNLISSNSTGSTTNQSAFIWGTDLSGNLHGAAGTGGFLALASTSNQSTQTAYTCYDGSGNVVALASAREGSPCAEYAFGPFGEPLEVRESSGGPANPFRFGSKYWDETNVMLYGFRYYSANMGRFVSTDPSGETHGANLYASCNNDLVDRMDILGLGWWYFTINNSGSYPVVNVWYLPGPSDIKCCDRILVRRFKSYTPFGPYSNDTNPIDDAPQDTTMGGAPNPAYAPQDTPDGPGPLPSPIGWPLRWAFDYFFKWQAVCVKGNAASHVLSTVTRTLFTPEHLAGLPYNAYWAGAASITPPPGP